MKCVKVDSFEGVSGIIYSDIDMPKAMTKDDLYIKHTAVGLEYEDIALTHGKEISNYKDQLQNNKGILGLSGVGIVEKAGSNVKNIIPEGSRVMYALGSIGAFSEKRVINSSFVSLAPKDLSDNQVIAVLRKGLMAHSLLFKVIVLRKEQTIIVHDASSPLEQMLCRWSANMGLKVIGITKNPNDEALLKNCGCDLVLNYEEDWDKMTLAYSKKIGVSMIFDPLGQSVFEKSLSCLCMFGSYVNYESRDGDIKNIDPIKLSQRSLFFTKPVLEHYKATRMELWKGAELVFDMTRKKVLLPNFESYKMSDVKSVIKKIEKKGTTNSIILLPDQ